MDKQIYIIHENDEWVIPLREELKNELASLSNAKKGPAVLKSSGTMFAMATEGLSRCN